MEFFGLDAFGDSALIIKGRIKTKPIQQWIVGREYRRRLKIVFENEGIEIPFPVGPSTEAKPTNWSPVPGKPTYGSRR